MFFMKQCHLKSGITKVMKIIVELSSPQNRVSRIPIVHGFKTS